MDNDGRKIDRGDTGDECPVRQGPDGVWLVCGYAQARAILRSTATVQAGLGVETVENMPSKIRRPVLYRDGPEHREHRRQTAQYFTPRRVDERYREVMVRVAETQLAELRGAGTARLGDLSFQLAIGVAAEVIGLTESRPGIRKRLESFFPEKFGTPGFTSPRGIYWFFRQVVNWLRIYLGDVRPAVRARRRQRRDDLISHLLDEGCSATEILGECLTFAAAGMVTTREFVTVAAWHLFTNDALLTDYRAAEEPGRLAILHEILRLEPVINRLRRRTTDAVEIPGDGEPIVVPTGELVHVMIGAANLDPTVVGEHPSEIRPGRAKSGGGTATGLAFGDGPHKCPGSTIAILETDIFLSRLFSLAGLRMRTPPKVRFRDEIDAYELRDFTVSLDGGETGSPG